MSSNPQSWKNVQLVSLTRQDREFGQKYRFSSVNYTNEEHTHQLNNLMEITNRILLNTQEIMKSGTGSSSEVIEPGNGTGSSSGVSVPGNISYALMQVKDTVDRIEEIVKRMDNTQTKSILSPQTTWDEKIQMLLGSVLTGTSVMIVNEALKALGAYLLIKNCLRTALHRITGNFDFESPPGLAGPHDEL